MKTLAAVRVGTIWVAVGAMGLGACGDQDVDPGPGGPADSGITLDVTYSTGTHAVSLGALSTVEVEGDTVVSLADVVTQLDGAPVLSDLTADFVAGDGFMPGSSSNCSGLIPVPGENLSRGYIDPSSRNLKWDSSLAYPGCLYVDDVVELLLADK